MSLEIVKPLYNYKKVAYSRLNRLFQEILKDCVLPLNSEDLSKNSLVFSHDPSDNVDGQFTVSLRGITLLKVKGRYIEYRIPTRGNKTYFSEEEYALMRNCFKEIFRIGSSTVESCYGRLHDWRISRDMFRFVSYIGNVCIFG